MANSVVSEEKNDKDVTGLYAYGGDKSLEELRPNHRGWNLIGNPFMMNYEIDFGTRLRTGELEEDPDEDGLWRIKPGTEGLLYIVEPVDNGRSEYKQVSLSDYEMKPFTAYFIQLGGSDPTVEQGITYNLSQKRSIIRRNINEYEDDKHPVWCAFTLRNELKEQDKTTLLISDKFTTGYDIMSDLVKMR